LSDYEWINEQKITDPIVPQGNRDGNQPAGDPNHQWWADIRFDHRHRHLADPVIDNSEPQASTAGAEADR
jgi:hypothetical protein